MMQAVNNSVSIPRSLSRPTLVVKEGKTDQILRIDAVVAQSWHVLGLALSTAAVLARIVTMVFPTSLSFTVLAVSLVALTLLAIKVTVSTLEPYMSPRMKEVADFVQATLGDLLLAMSDLFFQPLFIYKKIFEKKQSESNGPHIVVVHGYNGQSAQVSTYLRHRLEKMGARIHTINLGSSWLFGVDDCAAKLDNFLNKLKKEKGVNDVTIVCHSMGGVVTGRYYDKYRKDAEGKNKVNVHEIVTLGSPMQGTPIAGFMAMVNPFDKCTKDMSVNSELIKSLSVNIPGAQNPFDPEIQTRFLHIASKNDLIIPVESALFLNNKGENVERLEVSGVGHCGLPFSDEVIDRVVDFIRRSREQSPVKEAKPAVGENYQPQAEMAAAG